MSHDRRFASLSGRAWQRMNSDDGFDPDDAVWPGGTVFGVETDPGLWPEDLEHRIDLGDEDEASRGDDDRWRLLLQCPESFAKLGDLVGRG